MSLSLPVSIMVSLSLPVSSCRSLSLSVSLCLVSLPGDVESAHLSRNTNEDAVDYSSGDDIRGAGEGGGRERERERGTRRHTQRHTDPH